MAIAIHIDLTIPEFGLNNIAPKLPQKAPINAALTIAAVANRNRRPAFLTDPNGLALQTGGLITKIVFRPQGEVKVDKPEETAKTQMAIAVKRELHM